MTATRTIAEAATLTARRLAVGRHAAMEMFVLNLKLATTSTPMIATGASRIVHAETMCVVIVSLNAQRSVTTEP